MDRRSFLRKASAVPAVGLSAAVSGCVSGDAEEEPADDEPRGVPESEGRLSELSFYSPASQVPEDGGSVEDIAVVRAEETARSIDTTDSNPHMYDEGDEPPLVSEDGGVVGFGSTELVSDSNGGFENGNEEFLLNLWDSKVAGETVVWDEGHDQYWSLDRYERFHEYAEDEGYNVRATNDIASDTEDAAAVVVTSPSEGFTEEELEALRGFVEGGGAVFLFDQSDYQGHDETGNLNDIADALGLDFRFNSDQINDGKKNAGAEFIPLTSNFDSSRDYFVSREDSIQPENVSVEKGETYEVEVTAVTDGDTIDVSFGPGSVETVRLLGLDTSELPPTAVKPEEWTGIDSDEHLRDWAERATEFAEEKIGIGDTVELTFDEVEPTRGEYGRLLSYVRYDSTGDGSTDAEFNLEAVRQGYARVYSSGFGRHDEFAAAENEALEEGRGVWAQSDLESLDPYRNDDFDELFFPRAVAVEPGSGSVAVRSGGSASPSGAPLVCVDEEARVAVVGGPIIHEDYDGDYEFGTDTSGYGNYPFTTNLAYYLSDIDGDVFFEGGHRQFSTEGSMTLEDAAWYRRHVEGTGRRLRQVNSLTETLPDVNAASLVVSPPATEYTDAEVRAVSEFVDEGGSVILVGSAASDNHRNLNSLGEALGTDLRVTDEKVTDDTNNVLRPEIPVTSEFDTSYPLFGPHER